MILAADLLGFSLPSKVYIIILLYIIYYIKIITLLTTFALPSTIHSQVTSLD